MGSNTFLGNMAVFSFVSVSMQTDLNKLDINFKQPALDRTTFGDTWETTQPGLPSFTLALSGFINKTGGANDATLFGQFGVPTSGAFAIGLAGSTPGNPKYTGNAVETDLKEGVTVKTLAAVSGTLTGDGAPVRGTY